MEEAGALAELFASQDGVISVQQANVLGLSAREIHGRVARGAWRPVAIGVYRLSSAPYTERALVRAAAWVHRGVLDRTTAAWWHGLLRELPEPLTLSMRSPKRPARWIDCEVDVKRRSFAAEDLTELAGVAVVSKELAVLGSIGLVVEPVPFVEELLFQKEVTLASLVSALRRNSGMHGLAPARRLVGLLDSNTQGKAERIFRELLRDHHVQGWDQQHWVHGWPLDFAWPELKVVVEVDGFAFHRDHKKFLSDMAKRNALSLDGWLVLTFSYHDLVDDPIGCLEILLAALRTRGAMAG